MKLTVKQLRQLILQEVKANYNARNMDKHIGLDQSNARFDLDQANAEMYDNGKDENPDSGYMPDDETKQRLEVLMKTLSDLGVRKQDLPDLLARDIHNLFYRLYDFLN